MRVFRYLPPSKEETRAFYVFAFGAFLGQLMAFCLAFVAPNPASGSIALGGGMAILARFAMATWQFDSRRRRAINGRIELENNGLRITNERGAVTFVRFDEIDEAQSSNGRLQLHFRKQKFSLGAREIENGMSLTQEILKCVAKPGKPSTFIPLEPI